MDAFHFTFSAKDEVLYILKYHGKMPMTKISVNRVYDTVYRLLTKNRLTEIYIIAALPWYFKRRSSPSLALCSVSNAVKLTLVLVASWLPPSTSCFKIHAQMKYKQSTSGDISSNRTPVEAIRLTASLNKFVFYPAQRGRICHQLN